MGDVEQKVAIEVSGVSKTYDRSSPLKTMLGLSSKPDAHNANQVVALHQVNFTIKRGESVAIIGRNGSGKSSLLEIIAGTLMPTVGCARAHGRVAALLELGSGFDPGLSGRDNVFMNGLLLGLSKREIRDRFDEIVAFADIGDVLDRPVSTYSSGMLVRLAFSVQVALDPDILIVDEALSVGDFFFQQKCAALIKSLRDRGVTLLFVSHDMSMVRDVCTRALLLNRGQLEYDGEVSEASRRYYASGSSSSDSKAAVEVSAEILHTDHVPLTHSEFLLAETVPGALWARWPVEARKPGERAQLVSVSILNLHGQTASTFRIGDVAKLRVAYRVCLGSPIHTVVELTNRMGWLVTCIGTYTKLLDVNAGQSGEGRICDLDIVLNVEAGEYSVRVSLALPSDVPNLGSVADSTPLLPPIRVIWDYAEEIAPHLGLVGLPFSVSLNSTRDIG